MTFITVKMAILLEGVLPKSSVLLCVFCGQKDINKEICPVYGGKYLFHKAAHNGVDKFSQGRSKIADEAQPGVEVAETTVNTSVLLVLTHW
jgi:hypothetical protein